MYQTEIRNRLRAVIYELEEDIAMARTRDESVRLTRRVLKLREILDAWTG